MCSVLPPRSPLQRPIPEKKNFSYMEKKSVEGGVLSSDHTLIPSCYNSKTNNAIDMFAIAENVIAWSGNKIRRRDIVTLKRPKACETGRMLHLV